MQFFTASDLTSKASSALASKKRSLYESDGAIMARDASAYNSLSTYDIFLSHSFSDAQVVYGLKSALEESRLSTYVYWIDESPVTTRVTPETADRLKRRMQSCKALLYATSDNAQNSKWMPWELGYFDGIRGKVAVCPITYSSSFDGREYLGLYPVMEKDFWLWKDGSVYKKLHSWLSES